MILILFVSTKKYISSHWLCFSSSSTSLTPTTHYFPGTTMYFFLILGIKYVKHLCNSCSENPRFIFMTHICQVNDCEPIIIDLNTLWVLHPLTFEYRDLYRHSIIQFLYFFNVAIISIFSLCYLLHPLSHHYFGTDLSHPKIPNFGMRLKFTKS
jgi:hypothetical protein